MAFCSLRQTDRGLERVGLYVPGGTAPIFTQGEITQLSYFVDPIPQALTLTSIVIGACVTAMSMSLVMKLHESYGTLDTREIRRLHG